LSGYSLQGEDRGTAVLMDELVLNVIQYLYLLVISFCPKSEELGSARHTLLMVFLQAEHQLHNL